MNYKSNAKVVCDGSQLHWYNVLDYMTNGAQLIVWYTKCGHQSTSVAEKKTYFT